MNGKILKEGDKVIGPLTQDEFDERRRELRIEKIKFEKTYPEVP